MNVGPDNPRLIIECLTSGLVRFFDDRKRPTAYLHSWNKHISAELGMTAGDPWVAREI